MSGETHKSWCRRKQDLDRLESDFVQATEEAGEPRVIMAARPPFEPRYAPLWADWFRRLAG